MRRRTHTREAAVQKKDSRQEQPFFGSTASEPFFQANKADVTLHRMKIGSGTQPDLCGTRRDPVPADEVATVTSAINMVGNVANNPDKYPECHSFFAENCPGGKKKTLQETFNKISVWKMPPEKVELAGASVCPQDLTVMSYTYKGYKSGATTLASDFMHELMHNCGISGEEKHRLADRARLYCMGGGNKSFSISAGRVDQKVALALSLTKFLTEWRSGKLRPYAGLSTNFVLDFERGDHTLMHAAPVVGIRGRSNLLSGGERFGGLTLGADVGLGYGHFKELPESDAKRFGWHAGLILQLHAGIEFAIPKLGDEGREIPIGLDINYSIIKPLTGDAQTIQSVTFGFNEPF